MYDAPIDTLARLGWVLAAAVLLVLALRAVLGERAAVAQGPPRRPVVRGALTVLSVAAAVALLVVLALEVLTGLGW